MKEDNFTRLRDSTWIILLLKYHINFCQITMFQKSVNFVGYTMFINWSLHIIPSIDELQEKILHQCTVIRTRCMARLHQWLYDMYCVLILYDHYVMYQCYVLSFSTMWSQSYGSMLCICNYQENIEARVWLWCLLN